MEVPRSGLMLTIDGKIAQCRTSSSLHFNIRALEKEQDGFESIPIDFAHICRFGVRSDIAKGNGYYPNAPRSVISAKVKLALRWRSTLSEYTRVLRARRGSPAKKSVSARYERGQGLWLATFIGAGITDRGVHGI